MTEESMRPIVSVIVPVYNVQEYLVRAIESIRSQSLEEIEIILIDDGSSDGSGQICLKKEKEDNRIRVLELTHKGVSAARNAGLEQAKGEYVLFFDADDWADVDMIEYLYQRIVETNAEISTCEFVKEYSDGRKKRIGTHNSYEIEGRRIIDEINYNGEFSPFLFNKLFRRDLLSGIRFPNGVSLGEDYRFIMEVMLHNPLIARGGECKYHYFQRAGSVSYCGYSGREQTNNNRENYKETYVMLAEDSDQFSDAAMAYYVLQEMAVIISMVKSGVMDKDIIKSVQQVVRENLKRYVRLKRVPLYLKCCATLLSVNEQLLLMPYRGLFHKKRSAI